MFNRKTNATVPTNDEYESDVDVISTGRKLSAEINEILSAVDGNAEDHGIQSGRHSFPSIIPSARNLLSVDNLSKTHLSGIPEEMKQDYSNDDIHWNAHTNMGFEHMSLSNFKNIQKIKEEDSTNNEEKFKRDASQASIINMKDIQSDASIHTGLNFRKISTFVITPSEHRFRNGSDDKLNIRVIDKQTVPDLFIQCDTLKVNPATDRLYWMETYRWLKFEEDYNHDSQHFSYAHLSPLTIRGITNFRKLFSKCDFVLNYGGDTFMDLLNTISNSFNNSQVFTEDELTEIRKALVLKHCHVGQANGASSFEAPMYRYDHNSKCFHQNMEYSTMNLKPHSFVKLESFHNILSNARIEGKLEPGTESASVQIGALKELINTFAIFIRLDPAIKVENLTETTVPLRFVFVMFGPKDKENDLIEMGRVFSSMLSNLEFREIGYLAKSKHELIDAIKIYISHAILVSPNKMMTHETLAAMLPQMKHYYSDFISEKHKKMFEIMKKEIANQNQEITINRIEHGHEKHISINPATISSGHLKEFEEQYDEPKETSTKGDYVVDNAKKCSGIMSQFCPPLRYFIHDWKGYGKRFKSDFKDAFTKDNAPIVFVGFIFIYFVVLTPAITFGALLNAVNPKMTITMMLLSSGVFQFLNCVFGGQPFDIVGITGPIYAAEKTLGSLSVMLAIDLGAMRFWIGIYISIIGIIFTVFNGVVIMKQFRRSVEEVYNFLIAAIYILSAMFSMFIPLQYTAVTVPFANGSNINVIAAERFKLGVGGTTLFLAFFMTNFCLILIGIKKGTFFRRKIRKLSGSLNVPIGIILIIALHRIFFMPCSLPTLNVPPSNMVNFSTWVNIPSFDNIMAVPSMGHGFCFLIAISLFITLTCEVGCNGIMTSKSERKLLKPSLYSLNFFNVLVIFPIISGLLGWPYISGGTVRSHIHCIAMSKWSLRQPGVPAKIIGAAEQRVSGAIVGLLVFLSVFFGSALQLIPMAALYGMFLYLGVMGAVDLVFIRRFVNIFRRRKYWKAHDFLKDFPTWNITILVSTQIVTIVILIFLNCIQQFTTLAWSPLLYAPIIGLYGLFRGYILPRWKRLNTHLSKMDKKHPITLYADLKKPEQVIVTVDESSLSVTVVPGNAADVINDESEEDSDTDDGINMNKKSKYE